MSKATRTLNKYSNALYDDVNDIGFFGQYGNSSGTQYYTGLAKAKSTKMYYLFTELKKKDLEKDVQPFH